MTRLTIPVTAPYKPGLTTHDLYEDPVLSAEVDRGFKTAKASLKVKDGVNILHTFGTENGKLVHQYDVQPSKKAGDR